MKVLVAGGAGYIGAHTVKALLAGGFETVVLDDLSTGRRELVVPGCRLVVGDLLDREAVRNIFRENGDIAAVLHFASLIQVGESYRDPRKYYRHNLGTSLNLLEAMLEAGIGRFVFSSSAAVYGIPQVQPIPEDHPLEPINPYGATKSMVERILTDFDRAHGLRFVTLRYFNAAGADPDGALGEMHDPETHLIPNILLSVLGKRPALGVFGTDFPTPDGTAVRDYVHVADLADAHVLALRHLLSGGSSEAVNLGTNRGYSVLEVIGAAEGVTGHKVPIELLPRREGDVPVLLASREKARCLLGWEPGVSDIGTILRTAWDWHRKSV
ncbi:MAG TPA: UDP-glucose 4-epimerase GalE [Acidobacteriota bacterium]|nr:UDP-glucose 4-epimerase GalE [Acidobacteriota bacterium]